MEYSSVWHKVILPLVFSPLAGFAGGFALMVILSWVCFHAHPQKANLTFRRLQILSSGLTALSHGMNDAQKTMGVIALTLFLYGKIPEVYVPLWVKLCCALAMALGTAGGGWKIIKTMGHRIFKLEPIHGFALQMASSLVIGVASQLGAPVSTTHTISSTVLGVGASKRLSAVRWGVAGNMVVAWVLTIPASALVAALCLGVLSLIGLIPAALP